MIEIKKVTDPDFRYELTKYVLSSLPDWFGIPESLEEYCVNSRKNHPYFAAYEDGAAFGFIALLPRYPETDELHVTGILPDYHRNGVGGILLEAAIKDAKSRGVKFMTVKTLDASANYEPYDRSRNFYLKHGFVPLEVFPQIWDESNPCLFLVKYLGD